jgi:hypothetical protein
MYIFIQMSAEMWQFDPAGDLYFEKLVNGFLPKLLQRWTAAKTSHYVSVIVFSRWYYTNADQLHLFDDELRASVSVDHRGRHYQVVMHADNSGPLRTGLLSIARPE